MSPAAPELFLGLISGTSADGIDAALARFLGAAGDPAARCELVHGHTFAWPEDLRAQLVALGQGAPIDSIDALGTLDVRLGEHFASAAQALLAMADVPAAQVRAIGSHGQTLRHAPNGVHPFTMQMGDANIIAERCGIDTIADFRRRDVAAGGQGAPLVPAFHAAVFSDAGEERAVLNIGGIANLTLMHRDGRVRGFDTGPGNGLMDAWCRQHLDKKFDANGEFAASGQVHNALLESCLSDAWFKTPPPKSTGRDQFNLAWLEEKMRGLDIAAADVQATLAALTAHTIADALKREMPECRRVLVCGGGSHNPVLMNAIGKLLASVQVDTTASHGLHPDYVEATAFAWLAKETLARRPGNLPAVTGAKGLRVLGVLYPK